MQYKRFIIKSGVIAMEKFLHNEKWREFVRQNTLKNQNGDAVISRNDSWFNDDVWDDDYKELLARDDSAAGSVVR